MSSVNSLPVEVITDIIVYFLSDSALSTAKQYLLIGQINSVFRSIRKSISKAQWGNVVMSRSGMYCVKVDADKIACGEWFREKPRFWLNEEIMKELVILDFDNAHFIGEHFKFTIKMDEYPEEQKQRLLKFMSFSEPKTMRGCLAALYVENSEVPYIKIGEMTVDLQIVTNSKTAVLNMEALPN
ncbi:hypothetical protein HDU76_008412 [Blyttiomyces sp. JEL0837]|nr:hypothetical protein HDU76_008412 [Blyttiomyces sp. JEL0837]